MLSFKKGIFVVLLFFSKSLMAQAKSWSPLTDANRLVCSVSSPCLVKQRKTGDEFKVQFNINEKDGMLWLTQIKIQNSKNKEEKIFEVADFQGMFKNAQYEIFAADLNKDGFLDLAIWSSLSAKLGKMYIYMIYNPVTKSFVIKNEHLPELVYKKKNILRSLVSDEQYKINDKYELEFVKN